jgi:hypothetical protein
VNSPALQNDFSGGRRPPGGRAAARPDSESRIPRIGLFGAAAARAIYFIPERIAAESIDQRNEDQERHRDA